MANIVSFIIPGEIQTKARPRARVVNGKFAQMYTPKTTANYENLVKLAYEKATSESFGGAPLKITLTAHFLCPNEYKRFAPEYPACCKHKDLDNIAKTVLDALNGIAYDDDKQIHVLECSKVWDEKEFIEVKILEYGIDEFRAKEILRLKKLSERYSELEDKYALNGKLSKADMKRAGEIYLELEGTEFEQAPFIS